MMSENRKGKLLMYSMPFPSIGIFMAAQQHHISSLIFDESIRFEKMSYRNRYYVCGAQGVQLLTVPIAQGRNQRIPMKEVLIDNSTLWQKNHWKTLKTHYMRAPYFEFVAPYFEPLFEQKMERLVDFNRASIQVVQQVLRSGLTIDFEVPTTFSADEVWDIRRTIKPLMSLPETEIRNYHQVFIDRCGFQPEMSVLDYIFNEGVHL